MSSISQPTLSAADLQLYTGKRQIDTFCRIQDYLPTSIMAPASAPKPFADGAAITVPETFMVGDTEVSTQQLFDDTDTVALLVIRDGEIRHEQYNLTGGKDVRWTSFSVAKSFVATLVGIAVEEGLVDSIDDPVTKYIDLPAGSAYDGVPIVDILEMSSGARWNEDYSDPEADIHGISAVMAGMSTLNAFVAGMKKESAPGTICRYNSTDTQVLGMLVSKVSGMSLTDYMQAKICDPLGFEFESRWIVDKEGTELALGGLHMTARDYAKLGVMMLNGGKAGDTQVVPEAWVKTSSHYHKDHTSPDKVLVGGHTLPFGYGYQWWVMTGETGDYSAIGVYNQYIYVSPETGTVVVKLSANPKYGTSEDELDNKDYINTCFLRTLVTSF